MEEKKKRFRPSLTAYRRLEEENRILRETLKGFGDIEETITDNVCYRQAMINFSSMLRAKKEPAILCQGSKDCNSLISMVHQDILNRFGKDSNNLLQENRAYEKSNTLMETELKNLRERNTSIEGENIYLHEQIGMMKSRGFWARVFNREV